MGNKSLVDATEAVQIRQIIFSSKDEYHFRLDKIKDLNLLKSLYLETIHKDHLNELRKQVELRITQLGGNIA